MFSNLIQFPIESSQLQWEAREALRDIHNQPHLFLRVRLSGTHFPQRAPEPYIRIGEIRSRFALISEDGLSVSGYFDRDVQGGTVEFGYGEEPALLRAANRFEAGSLIRLDRNRLPREVKNLDRFPVPR